MRIGVVKQLSGEGYQAGVQARFNEAVALLVDAGATVVEVDLPCNFQYALAAYYLIPPSEVRPTWLASDAMRWRPAGPARGSR